MRLFDVCARLCVRRTSSSAARAYATGGEAGEEGGIKKMIIVVIIIVYIFRRDGRQWRNGSLAVRGFRRKSTSGT